MTAALPLLDSGDGGTFNDVWLTVGALIFAGAAVTVLGMIIWQEHPDDDVLFGVGFFGAIAAMLWPVILPLAVLVVTTWQLRRTVQRRRARPARRPGEGMMAPPRMTPDNSPKARYMRGEIELDEFERLTE